MNYKTSLYIDGQRDNEFVSVIDSLDNYEFNEIVSIYNLNQQSRLGNEIRFFNANNNVSLYVEAIEQPAAIDNDWLCSLNG